MPRKTRRSQHTRRRSQSLVRQAIALDRQARTGRLQPPVLVLEDWTAFDANGDPTSLDALRLPCRPDTPAPPADRGEDGGRRESTADSAARTRRPDLAG
jgi:hypothetical protein